jgi:hypothetical protein
VKSAASFTILKLSSALCAFVFFSGCVYSTHRPLHTLNAKLLDWANQQYNDATGHAVDLTRFPGATLSFSANETLGVGKYGRVNLLTAHEFKIPSNRGHFLTVMFLTDGSRCRIDKSAYETISSATQKVFSGLSKKLVPSGFLRIVMTRDGPFDANQFYALHLARQVDLRLYFPCEDGVEEVATYSALLTSLHELTHFIYRLHSGPFRRTEQEEIVADDAPACVYEALGGSTSAQRLRVEFSPEVYYAQSLYYGDKQPGPPTGEACATWKKTIESFVR